MISMARPFLADAEFVAKASTGRSRMINTCIACNQACLDHIFEGRVATCLVNPRAGHETELNFTPSVIAKKIAVVGAGPAGLSVAAAAAECGHHVVLYEQSDRIGGQLNIAVQIPGKEEFNETMRYFEQQLDRLGVELQLNTPANAENLAAVGYDAVVVATGIVPRRVKLPGIDHPSVLSYIDVLLHKKPVGRRAAIVGAGGIGFDTAIYLTTEEQNSVSPSEQFFREWGIDIAYQHRGGLQPDSSHLDQPRRQLYLLQRKGTKVGAGLSKTTGWIHRTHLQHNQVTMLNAVTYERIDDDGLHITRRGKKTVLEVDNIVICAGQEPSRQLADELKERGIRVHLIGGADLAAELDAKRAIDQGARLAVNL